MRSVPSPRTPEPTSAESPVTRPALWAPAQNARTSTAVLLVGPGAADSVEALKRCFATALPETDVLPFSGDERETLVRRLFADIKADTYVVADRAGDALALAQAVAAVARDGADLVVVSRLPDDAFADVGDHLLTMTLNYLFACGGGPVDAVAIACSHRFAQCYAGDGSLLDLTLHALRRRMPVGEIGMLDVSGDGRTARPKRSAREWFALVALIARLFAEERPRRTFGLAGIAAIAAGVTSASPLVRGYGLEAGPLPGWDALVPLGLNAAGVGTLAAGWLLDAMVQARQDVSQIGYAAIPRTPAGQSSVS